MNGRGKVVNGEYPQVSRKDPLFGGETALLLPLVAEGHPIGVLGLWQRRPNAPRFVPQDRDLAPLCSVVLQHMQKQIALID